MHKIRPDLFHPDISALSQLICMGYCGNDVGVSMCTSDAAFQRGSTKNRKTEIDHLAIRTLELCIWGAKLHRTRQTRRNRMMNITMFCAAVMASFTAQPEVCTMHKAVTILGACCPLDIWWWKVACKVIMCRRTFVRFCGCLAPHLVHQDTPFRW